VPSRLQGRSPSRITGEFLSESVFILSCGTRGVCPTDAKLRRAAGEVQGAELCCREVASGWMSPMLSCSCPSTSLSSVAVARSPLPHAPVLVPEGAVARRGSRGVEGDERICLLCNDLWSRQQDGCHTRFPEGNQMHLICVPGSSSTHMIDKMSVIS
jgi:hypothetical protein